MSSISSVDLLFSSTEYRSNFNKIAKILLISETGAGKSTFINYLCNYFHKGDINNPKIAIPSKYHPVPTEEFSHYEFNIYDNNQSKTNHCIQYMFTDVTTNKQYLFLDTPGFSDTHNIEQNQMNMNKIIGAITQLDNLTSIILVVNGSLSRLTMNFRYAINCLNSSIPDIILENVIVILTNAKKYESPFDLKLLNLHGKVYPFYMQNGAFVSDPKRWTKSIRNELHYDWNNSMNQIKLILETIDSFKQISIDIFLRMKQIRNDIKSIIHQIRLEMIQIQKIQDAIAQLDLTFKQTNRDVATYQDHTRHHIVEKIQQIDAPHHSTLCVNCNQVCHNNCRLNETNIVDAQILSQCLVMKNGKCQQCQNHCSYTNHYHAKKTIQISHETLHDVLSDLKEKYDQTYQNSNNCQEKIITVSETKELLEQALQQKLKEIKNKSIQLNEICSSFNLANEFKDLIRLLKTESNSLRNSETKLKAEKFIRKLNKFIHLIEEKQENNRIKRSSMQIICKDESIEKKSTTDINRLTISDLIELYHNTIDHDLMKSILNELHQRSLGKSTGPLLTSNDIILINKYLEKYTHKNILQLSYVYHKLQQQIQHIIQSDILNISNVNSELLVENFIVQTLLGDKEKQENNVHQEKVSRTMPLNISQSMVDSFPGQISTIKSQQIHPLPYPSTELIPSQTKSLNNNSNLIGFSHLNIAPYPPNIDPSLLPPLPSDYSPLIQHNQPQSDVFSRHEYHRYNSTDANITTSPVDYKDFMPMPMQTNNHQRLINLRNSNIIFPLNNTIESQHKASPNENSSIPDVIPMNNNFYGSSELLLNYARNDNPVNVDNEDLSALDNARLLLMYTNANLKQVESQKNAILQELERRCYGEYPMLIKEKRNLFQDKIKLYETRTIGELIIAQAAIRKKIRTYIKNDDVTLINDIPSDLIIEAHAVNQLILSKE
ncbi:unnamed protein product [Rotaria sp. Silwood2]|nr:unnamed protein product [Rotaria sp. Silwood2]CAF3086909.1 unnamed protein product [Rotaria sp. Silwood2]CAF4045405.1 unnamed protein product [Rotaria sp. Silwood2]CAF4261467.1 unnamed protein product [Rotaria sp. Silwood2]